MVTLYVPAVAALPMPEFVALTTVEIVATPVVPLLKVRPELVPDAPNVNGEPELAPAPLIAPMLADPESEASDQPAYAKNTARASNASQNSAPWRSSVTSTSALKP